MAGSAGDFVVEENSDGVVLNVQNTHTVELAVDGTSAFRVSVSYDGSIQAGKIDTIMVAEQKETASYQKVTDGDFVGIKTSFKDHRPKPQDERFSDARQHWQNDFHHRQFFDVHSKRQDSTHAPWYCSNRKNAYRLDRPLQRTTPESRCLVRGPPSDFPNGLNVDSKGLLRNMQQQY